MAELIFHTQNYSESIIVTEYLGLWIHALISEIEVSNKQSFTLEKMQNSFEEKKLGDFNQFLSGELARQLFDLGLIFL